MEYIKNIIERYKHIRSFRMLRQSYKSKYAFVGIGNHSTNNLYPVINYLHIPLKYICCKSPGKLHMIEEVFPHVRAPRRWMKYWQTKRSRACSCRFRQRRISPLHQRF